MLLLVLGETGGNRICLREHDVAGLDWLNPPESKYTGGDAAATDAEAVAAAAAAMRSNAFFLRFRKAAASEATNRYIIRYKYTYQVCVCTLQDCTDRTAQEATQCSAVHTTARQRQSSARPRRSGVASRWAKHHLPLSLLLAVSAMH